MRNGWTILGSLLVAGLVIILTVVDVSAKGANSVTVLHEGYVQPIEGRNFVPGQKDDGARRVASTVALVRGEDTILIADPGMVADFPKVLDKLDSEGVKPQDVTHVFISHHHPDHTMYVGLFPNAELVDFWGIYKGDLWSDHPDNYELAEGIRVLRTPGHTKEDASLVVETDKGTYVLTHLWWTADMSPEKDPLAWSQEELDKNRKVVLKIADWIIPGHGKLFKNPNKNP